MRKIAAALSGLGLIGATLLIGTAPAQAAPDPPYIETSDQVTCGQIDITLHNVSPWIYPVSVYVDNEEMTYGPTVDNRGETPDDQTATRTITFPEDSGTHTVRYRVQAGTESDLYDGLPVGEFTERTVESNCQPDVPNSIETSDQVECGQITISLHNVSPWIYPVSVYIDGAEEPQYGPVVDNRTDGELGGPQMDNTESQTYTFPEDSGPHQVRYVVNAGTESDLYDGLPVGEDTTRTIETDCQPDPGNGDQTSDAGDDSDAVLPDTGNDTPWWATTSAAFSVLLGAAVLAATQQRRSRGRHTLI